MGIRDGERLGGVAGARGVIMRETDSDVLVRGGWDPGRGHAGASARGQGEQH